MKNKKLLLSPDSSGMLFLKLPVRRGELEALEKDIANSGTTVDEKPSVSAPEKTEI